FQKYLFKRAVDGSTVKQIQALVNNHIGYKAEREKP
ncbi:hypothetical protein LCGC14_2993840, partial [marine sediment metagenome]